MLLYISFLVSFQNDCFLYIFEKGLGVGRSDIKIKPKIFKEDFHYQCNKDSIKQQ